MKSLNLTISNPLIGNGYTPGTSLAMHVNQRLAKLTLSELERLIKDNSELSVASWRVLMCLKLLGSSSQKAIVEFSLIDQAQASRALKLLQEKGFVISVLSDVDQRSRWFSITSEGEKYRNSLQPIVSEFHQRLTDCLTDDELSTYIRISDKIAQALVNK